MSVQEMTSAAPVGPPKPLVDRAWFLPSVVYVAALALRLFGWGAPIFGDEAWHYYAAEHWFRAPTNVYSMLGTAPEDYTNLFWWRPFFIALLAPAAAVSFDAWRLWHLVLTATTPLLGFLTLRQLKVRPSVTYAATALLLLQPVLFVWGVVVFPDGLLTTFVAAALWMHVRGRIAPAAVLLLGALWIKESALVAALYFCAKAGWDLVVGEGPGPWTRRLRPLLFYVGATALGILPLLEYLKSGGQPPGWVLANDGFAPLDRLLVHLALLPILVLGFLWRRTRWMAGFPLVVAAFYLFLTFFMQRHVEGWYFTLPSYLALVGAGLVADEALLRTDGSMHRLARPVALVSILLVAALAASPSLVPRSDAKAGLTHPLTLEADRAIWEEVAWTRVRGSEERDAFAALAERNDSVVALVDLGWFFALYPFSERADEVRQAFTDGYHGGAAETRDWTDLVEKHASLTLVHKDERLAANRALIDTYAPCKVYENERYMAFEGQRCPGRASTFQGLYMQYSREARP